MPDPFISPFDIMFEDIGTYRRVVASEVITPQVMGNLLGADAARVEMFHYEPIGIRTLVRISGISRCCEVCSDSVGSNPIVRVPVATVLRPMNP